MKEFISINNCEYRVEPNWNVICDFCEQKQWKITELANLAECSPSDINSLFYLSIVEGERLEGRKVEIPQRDLFANVNPDIVANFVRIFFRCYIGEQNVSEEQEKGSKKKKIFWISKK